MIHTMTIQHQLNGWKARRFLHAIGCTDEEATAFMNLELYDDKGKLKTTKSIDQGIPAGIHEVSLSLGQCTSMGCKDFYAYIRMEPLTVITGERHIALFECTEENIQRLQNAFRGFMVGFLDLDGTASSLNQLAEFSDWDAERVDYTRDIRMRNHDEVLAMMNLCKLLTRETCHNHAMEKTNTYGVNFTDAMFKFGNKTWEVEGYDKQAQVMNREERYVEQYAAPDVFQQLVNESANIFRFEYRRKKEGTRKDFEDRNVMRFLSETVADQWFHKAYKSLVGYDPFYVLDYQLQLKLGEVFPMSKEEADRDAAAKKRYDRARKKAKEEGRACTVHYKKQVMGATAQQYYAFLSFVNQHEGLMNAEAAFDSFQYADKRQFSRYVDNLRERGIAPVCIPKNWLHIRPNGNGREMDLPHDYLPNPIMRPPKD